MSSAVRVCRSVLAVRVRRMISMVVMALGFLSQKSCAHGLSLGDVVEQFRPAAVRNDHFAACLGGDDSGIELSNHAA